MPPWYQIHPIIVHFTVALLIVGGLFKAGAVVRGNRGFDLMSFWLLRLGFATALLAIGFGLLAEKTAPHVPAAWETLYDHKRLGLITGGVTAALWGIEEYRWKHPRPWLSWLACLFWLAVVGLVIATGNEGGELVYTHGMGVIAAPHL